jgi:DNA-binding protein HU-beta
MATTPGTNSSPSQGSTPSSGAGESYILNTTDLANFLSEQFPEVGKPKMITITRMIFGLMADSLVRQARNGEADPHLQLMGFGRFYGKKLAARTARNPKTGDPVHVPERFNFKWTPSVHIDRLMNGEAQGYDYTQAAEETPAPTYGTPHRVAGTPGTEFLINAPAGSYATRHKTMPANSHRDSGNHAGGATVPVTGGNTRTTAKKTAKKATAKTAARKNATKTALKTATKTTRRGRRGRPVGSLNTPPTARTAAGQVNQAASLDEQIQMAQAFGAFMRAFQGQR